MTRAGEAVGAYRAGIGRICAVKTDGTLWCWGYNADGWLGAGVNASDAPVQIAWLGSSVIDVAASAGMTCALKTDGTVWCGRSCVTADGGKTTCVPPTAPVEFDCR